MLKKLFSTSLIAFSIIFCSFSDSAAVQTECEHYFQTQVINGIRYLVEYSCDGSIINIVEIEE